MSWSFDDSLSTNRDKVRLKIGDINTADQILSNETIDALLTEHGSDVELSAISCCRAIIAKYNRALDRNAAGMSANRSIIVDNYRALLSELLKANRGNSGARYSGSFSRDRKETIESDPDFIEPFARSGQFDYPGTGPLARDPNADDV